MQKMNAVEMAEVLKVLQSSLSAIKWRLRPASKRRLETDVLALCSGMRPVIMVDYGGKMPELKDHLCAFLELSQKESSIFKPLRVMVIEDMIYLTHVKGLAELVKLSLNLEMELSFVDIEQDPPKMMQKAENNSLATQIILLQELFASSFPSDAAENDVLQLQETDSIASAESSIGRLNISQCSAFVDLSSCMQGTLVTVPTLNGWLLGYPVVYLFSKEHIQDAIYNLSSKSLHLYRILVVRNDTSSKGSRQEELMSFSVPYELSIEGSNEPWAEAFMARMHARLERCRQVWGSMKLEFSAERKKGRRNDFIHKSFS